jgi:hypothetical protein
MNRLYNVLYELGIPEKLVRLVSISLTNTKGKMVIQGEVSEDVKSERGLKQDDVLFTILFNFVLQKVIRNITSKPNRTVFKRTIQYLAHETMM